MLPLLPGSFLVTLWEASEGKGEGVGQEVGWKGSPFLPSSLPHRQVLKGIQRSGTLPSWHGHLQVGQGWGWQGWEGSTLGTCPLAFGRHHCLSRWKLL